MAFGTIAYCFIVLPMTVSSEDGVRRVPRAKNSERQFAALAVSGHGRIEDEISPVRQEKRKRDGVSSEALSLDTPSNQAPQALGDSNQAMTTHFGLYATGVATGMQGAIASKVTVKVAVTDAHVVIAGPPTFKGGNPAVPRMEKTSSGITAWLAETNCSGDKGFHLPENAGYAVFKQGQAAGSFVGTVTVNKSWTKISLPPLGPSPFIFAFSQDGNAEYYGNQSQYDTNYITIRTMAMDSSSFRLRLQTDEASHSSSQISEKVGYLALSSGCVADGAEAECGCEKTPGKSCVTKSGTLNFRGKEIAYEIGLVYTFNTYSVDKWTEVTFKSPAFSSTPVILANMQTTNGGNPASIRIRSSDTTGFKFKIDEDNCNDTERKHVSEWVAYLAIEDVSRKNSKFDTRVVQATGVGVATGMQGAIKSKININLALTGNHVLISGPPTFNGGNPAVPRMEKTALGFSAWLAETNCTGDDGFHLPENTGYAAFEQGQTDSYVVGTVMAKGSGWTTVRLPALGHSPFIFPFSQNGNAAYYGIQSLYDLNYITIRTQAMDSSSFKVRLQTDESSRSTAVISEEVGYLAISSGCAADGTEAQCGCAQTEGNSCATKAGVVSAQGKRLVYETGLVYTFNTYRVNKWTTVKFKNKAFTSTPVILANMQTTNGGNPAAIRIGSSDTMGFSFKIDEDSCNDTERKHISEWVAYLAIEEPGEAVVQTVLTKAANVGDVQISVNSMTGFNVGDFVLIGNGEHLETNKVVGFGSLILERPLRKTHAEGWVVEKDNTIPTTPGCHVKHPTSSGLCPARPWELDLWGKLNTKAFESEEACQARKEGHDVWYFEWGGLKGECTRESAGDSQWLYVAETR